MIAPQLAARMKKPHERARNWIKRDGSSILPKRTCHAGKRKVRKNSLTPVSPRMDMIDMECRLLGPLRQQAILAQLPGPLAYPCGEKVRHPILHDGYFRLDAAALAFINDNISASSVRAFASRRSPAVSFPPRSWRSSKSCKRSCRAGGKRNCFQSFGRLSSMTTFCATAIPSG